MITLADITRIGKTLTTYTIVKWRVQPTTGDLVLINALGQKFTVSAIDILATTIATEETPLIESPSIEKIKTPPRISQHVPTPTPTPSSSPSSSPSSPKPTRRAPTRQPLPKG